MGSRWGTNQNEWLVHAHVLRNQSVLLQLREFDDEISALMLLLFPPAKGF